MSTGFQGPIVHGPQLNGSSYKYRTGMGMCTSAEFDVFHDDFHQFVVATAITNGPVANTPWGWQSAAIDTGETVAINTTAAIGRNGVLTFSAGTASEGAAIYTNKSFQLTSGKRMFIETRVQTVDVTDNVVQFGLSSLTSVTTPVSVWDTTNADVISFGIPDATAATAVMYTDKDNAGITTTAGSTPALTVDTWHTLAIYYDGARAYGFVNGEQVLSTATTIPTGVALGAFFGAVAGNGGTAGTYLDYFRVVSER